MTMQFSPTVVIGLGSTGQDIVDHLDLLMQEEFGPQPLPIFQALAFETDEGNRPRGRLTQRALTIPAMDKVRYRFTSGTSERDELLREWLPEWVINVGDAVVHGAKSYRPLGRLLLWENWDQVQELVRSAIEAAQSNVARQESLRLLREVYKDVAAEVEIGNRLSVYVVCSFCGGSGSGMAADLGYMIRAIAGQQAKRLLVATILSEVDARDGANVKLASNCHAALVEHNFLNLWGADDGTVDQDGGFRYRIPNVDTEYGLGEAPYQRSYVLSRSNGRTTLDQDALSQLIAGTLFLQVAGQGNFDGDHTDLSLGPDANGYAMRFSSAGLTMIWYPKTKIAGLTACRLGREYCDGWLDEPQDRDQGGEVSNWRLEAEKAARADRDAIVESVRRTLLDDIQAATEPTRTRIEGALGTGQALAGLLKEEDKKALTRAAEEIRRQQPRYQQLVFDRLADRFDARLFADGNERGFENVPRMRHYLDTLRKFLTEESQKQRAAVRYPPDFAALTALARAERDASRDIALKATFSIPKAVRWHRDTWQERFRGLLAEQDARLANVLLRETLERIVDPQATVGQRYFLKRLDERLEEIAAGIRGVRRDIGNREAGFRALGSDANVVSLQYQHDSLEHDVEALIGEFHARGERFGVEAIQSEAAQERADVKLYRLWEYDSTLISNAVVSWLQRTCGGLLQGHEAASPAHRNLDDASQLAANTAPYVTHNARFQAPREHRQFRYVFGESESQRQLITSAAGWSGSARYRANGISHIVMFYEEEPAFSIDMLGAIDPLRQQAQRRAQDFQREQRAAKAHEGHATHKQEGYFSLDFYRQQRIARLLLDAAALLPSLQEKLCIHVGEELYYVDQARGMRIPLADPARHHRLSEREGAVAHLNQLVESLLAEKQLDAINEEIRASLQRYSAPAQQATLDGFQKYVNAFFKVNG